MVWLEFISFPHDSRHICCIILVVDLVRRRMFNEAQLVSRLRLGKHMLPISMRPIIYLDENTNRTLILVYALVDVYF